MNVMCGMLHDDADCRCHALLPLLYESSGSNPTIHITAKAAKFSSRESPNRVRFFEIGI